MWTPRTNAAPTSSPHLCCARHRTHPGVRPPGASLTRGREGICAALCRRQGPLGGGGGAKRSTRPTAMSSHKRGNDGAHCGVRGHLFGAGAWAAEAK